MSKILTPAEKFRLAISLSDEGIEMLLMKIKRENPHLSEKDHFKLLNLELRKQKNRSPISNLKSEAK